MVFCSQCGTALGDGKLSLLSVASACVCVCVFLLISLFVRCFCCCCSFLCSNESELSAGARFCSNCGHKFGGAAPAPVSVGGTRGTTPSGTDWRQQQQERARYCIYAACVSFLYLCAVPLLCFESLSRSYLPALPSDVMLVPCPSIFDSCLG